MCVWAGGGGGKLFFCWWIAAILDWDVWRDDSFDNLLEVA